MNSDDDAMPDTQPCENWTQTQSQDINSQTINIWGNLVPSMRSSKWGITTFPLIQLTKDRYSVGRSTDCDIDLSSTTIAENLIKVISKIHFYIVREVINEKNDAVIFLEDNSANGTFINRKLVGKGKRQVLDNDDVISLSRPSATVWRFISMNVYDKVALSPELRSNYAVIRSLGSGICGEVKMIYSKIQHKAFAIKAITKHVATMANVKSSHMHDPNRIMNEVKILKALNNPFIIKMEDIVDTPSKLYIILELMEGGELFDRIRANNGLPEKQTKFIFYQIVNAVNYLHTQGITHRDLKPENILLASDADYPLVKISDFGLSKLVDAQTMMKTCCGTPLYAAPEILLSNGRGAYTNLVDVWSLGVILYICLAGRTPFIMGGKDLTLCDQILEGRYTFPQREFLKISKQAIDLIKGMMTVEVTKRKTIRQVMFHPWLLDRQIKFQVEKMIRYNNENKSPNVEQDVEERGATSAVRNLHVFGVPGQITKRRRIE